MPMRALVLDDSGATRLILKKMLVSLGFEVAEAIHGVDGLRVLNEGGARELALVDWNMPEMNGLEFVRSVRSQPAWAAMRIVMVTTEVAPAQMVRALEAGANEYVMKPFEVEAVRDKLRIIGLLD